MKTFDCIMNRKSVRNYTGEKISEEELIAILLAGNASPVGHGKYDTMHMTVVENPKLLDEINQAGAELMKQPELKPLYGAPTLILVSTIMGNENVSYSNAAMMVHSMELAATDLGVGSCCIWGAVRGILAKPELLAKLDLPEGYTLCCGLIVGKTTETFDERNIAKDRVPVNRI